MSTIIFIPNNISNVPNPSGGSVLVGYDSDGILKQKDSSGTIKPISYVTLYPSDPAPSLGQIYYNTSGNALKVSDGSTWFTILSGGSSSVPTLDAVLTQGGMFSATHSINLNHYGLIFTSGGQTIFNSLFQVNGTASFSGSVAGATAVNANQFVTLGQVNSIVGGTGSLSASFFAQGGNSFGVTASLGSNDRGLILLSNGNEILRGLTNGHIIIGATSGSIDNGNPFQINGTVSFTYGIASGLQVTGTVSGATAVHSNEFMTLGQYNLLTTKLFAQGGNTFGATAVIGTLDSNSFVFQANGNQFMSGNPSGLVLIGSSTASHDGSNLQVVGSASFDQIIVGGYGSPAFNANIITNTISASVMVLFNLTANGGLSTQNLNVGLGSILTGAVQIGTLGTSSTGANLQVFGSASITGRVSGATAINSNELMTLGQFVSLTGGTSSLTSSYFVQSGNSFGATAVLGTKDNNNFSLILNGNEALRAMTASVPIAIGNTNSAIGIAGNLFLSGPTFSMSGFKIETTPGFANGQATITSLGSLVFALTTGTNFFQIVSNAMTFKSAGEITYVPSAGSAAAIVLRRVAAGGINRAYISFEDSSVDAAISTFDYNGTTASALPKLLYLYSGKELFNNLQGNLILAYDGTQSRGNVIVGTSSDNGGRLQVLGTSSGVLINATASNQLSLSNSYTPTSSADTNGVTGSIAWDTNYIYVKTGSGWMRATMSSF